VPRTGKGRPITRDRVDSCCSGSWCKKECPRLYKDRYGEVELDPVGFGDLVGSWEEDCLPPVEVLLRMSVCCCVTTTTVLPSVHVLLFWVCEFDGFDYTDGSSVRRAWRFLPRWTWFCEVACYVSLRFLVVFNGCIYFA
jgi:hypothetical protein